MSEIDVKELAHLAGRFVEAFGWGLAARERELTLRHTSELKSLYSEKVPADALRETELLFLARTPGPEILGQIDGLTTKYPALAPLTEFLADLAVIKLIIDGVEAHGEEYLFSAAWEEIETDTLERGTELLNALMYLKDCRESNDMPDLKDFLFSFLLDEEEDYQDEFGIYEPFIRNQHLVESRLEDVLEIGEMLQQEEVGYMFIPLMVFFRTPGQVQPIALLKILNEASNPALSAALYILLNAFFSAKARNPVL